MSAPKFADSHNMVAFLAKPTESDGFKQILDFLNANPIKYALTVNPTIYTLCIEQFWATTKVKTVNAEVQLQALVYGKKVIITETSQLALMGYEKPSQKLTFYKAFFSPQWKFLIHTILQCLSAKSTAWNEFSSILASTIICLATNQKFNFSKYIFESMVKNVDSSVKFLMYPRFVQVFLDKQVGDMSTHDEIFVTPSHTKKVFGNMKRIGNGFSEAKKQSRRKQRKDTEIPQSSVPTEPIADEAANEENVPIQSNDPPLSRVNTLGSAKDRLSLKELIDLCTKLCDRVLDLETTKTAQAKEIASLKKIVKKLERKRKSKTPGMKRLFKIGRSAQVVSSKDEGLGDQEDASKQGRKIDDIDKDAEVTLVDETQGSIDDAQMFDTDVFNGEEVFVVEQIEKVVEEVVSTAEVVVQELVQSTTTTIPSTIPRAKGIVFHEQEQAPTPIVSSQQLTQVKDKGKGKMVEEEPMKKMYKKELLELDEELAFKLQAKEDEQARLAREKAREPEELTDKEKARLLVELLEKRKKHFAALRAQEKRNKPLTKAQRKLQCQLVNMFVDKDTELVKEISKKAGAEMAQESSSKRAGDELKQEKEKKQKIDDDQEEAEMKKLIKVVPDEEEVAIDAIPLATKPSSIVDWKIVKEGKIGLFQIIRANGSSKRYSSMIQMLRDFDREDLETIWKLVKAKHGSTRPKEGYKRVL
ncbi:hypothetical protein Tco_0585540 [Tanacetum coccineum]